MVRVVHVLGKLDRGGIETWLKDVIINYDKSSFQMDFILTGEGTGAYDEIVKLHGSRIKIIPLKKGLFSYLYNLYIYLKKEKYDIVHAHPHFFCGIVSFIAYLAKVPTRISHSHSDRSDKESHRGRLRKLYLNLQYYLIKFFSTYRLACSDLAGKSLYRKLDYEILHCGIDFRNFIKEGSFKRRDILKDLGLPEEAICIGHVGRFCDAKNHAFLIDVFDEFNKTAPNSYLLLIGEGPLKQEIIKKVACLNLSDKVLFLGGRNDVNVLMKDVFDVFLFPSLYEGLGIVLLEAQMAGLKCLISDKIPKEAIVVKEHVICSSLNDSPILWATRLLHLLYEQETLEYNLVVDKMEKSTFSIETSLNKLCDIYSDGRCI